MIKKFSESAEVRVSKHHPLKTNSATLAATMASIEQQAMPANCINTGTGGDLLCLQTFKTMTTSCMMCKNQTNNTKITKFFLKM